MTPLKLKEDELVMYINEGMVGRQFPSFGLPRRPPSVAYMRENPTVFRVAEARARGAYRHQGPELFRLTGGNVRTILDIGCGLGLASLGLYQKLAVKPFMFLVDSVSNKHYDDYTDYMDAFRQDGTDFVTDLRVTHSMFMRHGVSPDHVRLIQPDQQHVGTLRNIDLVISYGSWFYHYGPEVYWNAVEKVMHPDSMLRVEIRWGEQSSANPEFLDFLHEKFVDVQIVRERKTWKRPKKRYLEVFARTPKWLS